MTVKRALKVANVMGRGFTGVHNEADDEDADDLSNASSETAMQGRINSELFMQSKKLPVDDDESTRLSP